MKQMKKNAITRGIIAVRAEPSVADLVRNIEAVNTAFAEFRKTNDERIAALAKNGSVDVLITQKLDTINAAITQHQAAIDETTKILAAIRAGGGGSGDNNVDPAQAAYRTNFNAYFRRGQNESEVREYNAAATRGSNPDGGYLVTDQMESTIDRVLGTVSAMRAISNVISITGGSYSLMVGQGGATSGWVGETGARPETNNPRLAKIEIPVHELYANPYATQTLLDDASVDIAAWLAGEVSIEFAEEEGAAFINGTGASQPRGLLSYDTVANASWAWGKLGYIASGKASTFDTDAGNNGTEKLISLTHALKQGLRPNARFLLNTSTLETVRKFKDSQANYVWQPSIAAGMPSTLLGYEVTDDDNMPSIAANAFPIAFGDFRRGYQIVDRQGVRVLRDPYTNKPYVSFYTTKRVGGGIRNFQAIKLLKIAA